MKIDTVMTPGCKFLSREATLADAARLMASENFGSAPVADGERLVGMITDRDIVIRGVSEGFDPNVATVAGCMTDKVFYCFNDEDVGEVAENMATLQVRRLPVVDREKRLVGIVSLGDLSTRGADESAGEALEAISKAPATN